MSDKAVKTKNQDRVNRLGFSFNRKWFASPYVVFIAVFVVFPMFLIVIKAFTDGNSGGLTFDNFARFFSGADLVTFLLSALIALVSTLICLLIGYPVAYIMAHTKLFKNPYLLILIFILPMWINFLLRVYAMKELLESLDIALGWGTVVLGMVYDFLPFMILPLYNSLNKMDKSILDASADLGANKRQVFFRTVVPLSMPGIMSGITLVFVPIMSAYAVSDAMSDGMKKTIGRVFEDTLSDVNYLAAMAIIMSLFIVVMILVSSRYERIGGETGGSLL